MTRTDDLRCAAIWNGCTCDRRPHGWTPDVGLGTGHVWRNTLDGDLVDPALYPTGSEREAGLLREVSRKLYDAKHGELTVTDLYVWFADAYDALTEPKP